MQNGTFYEKYLKRALDFFCALVGVIVLSPVLVIVAILVRTKLGSPVIFKQKRPGHNEKIFTLYKFRTMTDGRDEHGVLLSDEERLTEFGKFLRSTSLDELPELFNILRGDMAVVGPRPQLVKDMVFMTEKQRKRHAVRQGLTGLAQVNGRNNITWEEKIDLDLAYIQNITFLGDVKILFQTIAKVIKREDVATEGMDTAEDLGEYLLRKQRISKELYELRIRKSIQLSEVS